MFQFAELAGTAHTSNTPKVMETPGSLVCNVKQTEVTQTSSPSKSSNNNPNQNGMMMNAKRSDIIEKLSNDSNKMGEQNVCYVKGFDALKMNIF